MVAGVVKEIIFLRQTYGWGPYVVNSAKSRNGEIFTSLFLLVAEAKNVCIGPGKGDMGVSFADRAEDYGKCLIK